MKDKDMVMERGNDGKIRIGGYVIKSFITARRAAIKT